MLAETIGASLYSSMVMSIAISILAGGFYLLGRAIFGLLRLSDVSSSSIAIGTGMASVTFFGWYVYRLGMPLTIFIVSVFFISAAFFVLTLIRGGTVGLVVRPNSIYALPFFSLAFSLQALIAFNVTNNPIGTMGNNDIYDWSILAEHLLGAPGYDNVFTADGRSAQQNRIDSFGTFFIFSICAKFINTSTLEASTFFTVLCLSLIGLSIFDIVKRSFGFKDGISFGIALLVSAGSFFFYITYNNFYGQLLATFFYLTMIGGLLHIAMINSENGQISFFKRVALPVFSLIGILIVYQSGFLVFTAFSVAFCVIYAIFCNSLRDGLESIMKRARFLLFPFVCGILLALIILPELAMHTVQRTITVKNSLDGWPLPLISPVYLFAIPVLKSFPLLIGSLFQYMIVLGVAVFVFIFAYLASKRQSTEIASRLLVFVIFFGLSLTTYLLAFYLKGGVYQVWKLAAFVVLPLSFIFYVSCTLILQESKIFGGLFRKLVLPFIICGCVFVVKISPAKLEMRSISYKIEQLKAAKRVLHDNGIENVVLYAMSYGETMMAFNILSNNFKLFPLVQTYVHPVNVSLVQQLNQAKTRVLVDSKCFEGNVGQVGSGGYKIISFDEMLAGSSKHFFGEENVHCTTTTAVRLLDGFSVREAWGVWTIGNKAHMLIDIPLALVGSELNLMFEVRPFGESQTVVVKIGGYSENLDIKQATNISIVVPSKISSQKQLSLNFYIDHPISPSSIDHASTDTRLLGIGFINLNVSAVH